MYSVMANLQSPSKLSTRRRDSCSLSPASLLGSTRCWRSKVLRTATNSTLEYRMPGHSLEPSDQGKNVPGHGFHNFSPFGLAVPSLSPPSLRFEEQSDSIQREGRHMSESSPQYLGSVWIAMVLSMIVVPEGIICSWPFTVNLCSLRVCLGIAMTDGKSLKDSS